jgi:nucleotide-binding universal stress UspA family protein
MTYTSLLVPVEADFEPDCRLAFAVNLANQFDAKLVGVGAEHWRSPVSGVFDIGYVEGDLIQDKIDDVTLDLKRAEAKFKSIAAAVHKGVDWRSSVSFPLSEITAQARCADLIVTSRIARYGVSDYYTVAAPGALALQAGRPVIIAQADATKLELRSVVIGWKDTRESRRVVTDALPLLKRAQTVVIAEVCNHQDADETKLRLDDVAGRLLRHGVQANTTVCVEEKGSHAPQQFLEMADQYKADLIVAGAYGHSRIQEWVFGGFTQALLSQSSRAVLLSH